MKYIPSGIHSATELQTKMSLYLLGQLYYGITLVYQVQVDAFLSNINEIVVLLILCIFRRCTRRCKEYASSVRAWEESQVRVLMQSNTISIYVYRKRTANELDFPIDAEEQATKKRRSAKTKIAAILDLNDPVSIICYVYFCSIFHT